MEDFSFSIHGLVPNPSPLVLFPDTNTSIHTTLNHCEKEKLAGNEEFQVGHYHLAEKAYQNATPIFSSLYAPCIGVYERKVALECTVLLNRSLCKLKCGNAEVALELSKKALEISPKHPKAFYRSGLALVELKKYDEARQILLQAQNLLPEDRQIQLALIKLNERDKKSKEEEKKLFSGMFK